MTEGPETPSNSGSRLPGLDGLRAVAVLLVLLVHQHVLQFGWIGVQIFFVLSGFLITRSLWTLRDAPLKQYLGTFYARRSLRIFPLYFAFLGMLGIAAMLGYLPETHTRGLPYAATYTYNLWNATADFSHSRLHSHFWSLCIEEQFYLLWPFVIFYCSKQRLRTVLLAMLLAGPFVRLGLAQLLQLPEVGALSDFSMALYVLPFTHFDAFAAGAFIALFPLRASQLSRRRVWSVLGAALGAGLLHAGYSLAIGAQAPTLGSLGYPIGLANRFTYTWGYSAINICSALVVSACIHRQFLPRLLESRLFRFIGKISYGFYIFHYPLQPAIAIILPGSLWLQIPVQLVLTTLLASLSFYLLETPFLKLKGRYAILGSTEHRLT